MSSGTGAMCLGACEANRSDAPERTEPAAAHSQLFRGESRTVLLSLPVCGATPLSSHALVASTSNSTTEKSNFFPPPHCLRPR